MRRLIVIGILCSVLAFGVPVFSAKNLTITLLATVEVTGKDISLADVVETDTELCSSIANVYLGSAALPGSSRRLTRGQIEVRLRQAGLKPQDFNIVGATEVQVTTGVAELNSEKSSSDSIGAIAVIAEDSNAQSNLHTYDVVVPIENIARHQIIQASDLRVETRQTRTVPSNLVMLDDLVGKRATRLLVAGSELTIYAAEVPPVVERGDMVTIIAEVGSVVVTALGKVEQDGGLGEIIAVENVNSRTKIYGEVISSEIVKIGIGGLK